MQYIHVKNIETYHPGYKDRNLMWAKINIAMAQGDPEMEMIESEIDKWRFICMILLELQARKPLPLSDEYFARKGFDVKKRPMSLTVNMLHNFLEIVTEDSKVCNVEENRIEESRVEKNRIYVDFEKSTVASWNQFCLKFPILSKINEISDKRRTKLKKRFESESFKNFEALLNAMAAQKFLLGENERGWKISFDWIIENDTNYLKVLENKYAQVTNKPKTDDGIPKEWLTERKNATR